MKIAEIVYGLAGGGAPNVAFSLMNKLIENGHIVHFIRINIPYNNEKEERIVEDLNNRGIKHYILNRKPKRLGIYNIFKLIKILNKEKYDVVHSHLLFPDIYTALSAFFCNHHFKHLITIHNTVPYHKKFFLKTIFRKSIFVRCSPVIKEISSNIPDHVIPNGIDLEKFKPEKECSGFIRRELKLPEDSYLIVSVGNLRKQKNHSAAIEMMDQIINTYQKYKVHYLICGHGSEKKYLQQQVTKNSLEGHVHFLGLRTDIPKILHDCNLFINISRWEGLPLAVIEALASGIQVLLSPIAEHLAICENIFQCYFAEELTGESFAKKVNQIINQKTKFNHSLILEKREFLLDLYSIETFSKSYENLLVSLSGVSKDSHL